MGSQDRLEKDRVRFAEWTRTARESGETRAIPAATVVLLRDGSHGIETIMLRKNSKIAFGGMWVFPGGRIDDEDRRDLDADDIVAAARVAAAREAREEADMIVDPSGLVLFAHWVPPAIAPKRYATWFFAARAGTEQMVIDDGEIVEGEWMSTANALERHHEGEIELAPPTWVTLHTIDAFDEVDHALAALDERPARYHETRIGRSTEGPVAMWAGDAGYDANDPSAEGGRHRLEMFEQGYRYLDTDAR